MPPAEPDPDLEDQLHELFCAAIELPPADREDLCRRAAAERPELGRELRALLDAAEDEAPFLETPVVSAAPLPLLADAHARLTAILSANLAPDPGHIGPYRILQRLGAGGMGIVYLAEQSAPVPRRVALKVIKPGMDSERILARFDAERQALARMDHPGIARIFDGGATAQGRPYFAMEFVDGQPIHSWCQAENLSTRQRIELLCRVCDAVQHAHHKGVLHRDLKPSNILVTIRDGIPCPVVIDFGIARATTEPLTDATLTAHHEVVGTLEYAAPEQAAGSGSDVDSRADVYSLGVVLCELLTDARPFDPHTPASERRPTPPSALLARAHRELRAPARSLRGEPDWITLKALEADRERRYPTVSELAADLRRYLRHEPVLAGPPSVWYRLQTFVRRNRGQVTAGALVAAALLAGGALALVNMLKAQALADHLAITLARAESTADVLVDWLERINLENGPLSKQAMLDRAADEVDEVFADRPHAQARVHRVLGEAYASIGSNDQAIGQLGAALALLDGLPDTEPAELLEVLFVYAWPLTNAGNPDLTAAIHHRILGASVALAADDDPVTAALAQALGRSTDFARFDPQRFEALAAELLARAGQRLPAASPQWLAVADILHDRLRRAVFASAGHVLEDTLARVERIYVDRLGLPETNMRVISLRLTHLHQLSLAGRREDLERGREFAVDLHRLLDGVLPPDHSYQALLLFLEGSCHAGLDRPDRARSRFEAAHGIMERNGHAGVGRDHVLAAWIDACEAVGDPERARALRPRLIESLLRIGAGSIPLEHAAAALGPEHADLTARLRRGEADAASTGELPTDLLALLHAARERFDHRAGDRRAALVAARILRIVQLNGYRPTEVVIPTLELCVEALEGITASLQPHALALLGSALLQAGQPAAVLPAMDRALAPPGIAVPEMFRGLCEQKRGRALSLLGRDVDAEAALRTSYAALDRVTGLDTGNISTTHRWLQEHWTSRGAQTTGAAFAAERLRLLLQQHANLDELFRTAGWIVIPDGGSPEAVALALATAQRLCRIEPDHPAYRLLLGAALLRSGDPSGAREAFETVTRHRTGTSGAEPVLLPALLALALARLGEDEQAASQLAAARAAESADPRLRLLLDEAAAALRAK